MNDFLEMNRRSLLQRIGLLVGAAAIPAGCSDFSGNSGNDFALNDTQRAVLAAFADTVIPRGDTKGALDVEVPQNFEKLLQNWASLEHRTKLAGALDKLSSASISDGGGPLQNLKPAERLTFVEGYDKAAFEPAPAVPDNASEGGLMALAAGAPIADPEYGRLKQLVVLLYYYSEHGQTMEMDYVHVPGRWDPSVPVSPDTRPAGGTTYF